jgi:hypothetical protein
MVKGEAGFWCNLCYHSVYWQMKKVYGNISKTKK